MPSRAQVLVRMRLADKAFQYLTQATALGVLALLGCIILALIIGALPALRTFGFDFLLTQSWNPVTERFGALAPVYGTIVTSVIAMAIAIPIGLLVAVFLTELCPLWLRRPVGIAIELLAGIPSIIYGIWGLFVLAPFLQVHVQPLLIDVFGEVPILSSLFAGPPYGIGTLTAGSFWQSWSCLSLPRSRAMCSRRCRRCSRNRPTGSAARPGKCSATWCCPIRARA
jgi:phosphate transport system permease protein